MTLNEMAPPGREDQVKALKKKFPHDDEAPYKICLLYTSPSPRDRQKSRMPSSA